MTAPPAGRRPTGPDKCRPPLLSGDDPAARELETRVSAFAQSPAYERIVSSGYLSALRYYDTYLYVGRSGKQESVQHFYMRLAGFCASTTCLYAGLRAALQRARPEIESDMEVFDYYFEHLTSQTVCCSTPFMRFAGVENSTLASCILTTPDLSSEWDVTQALYRHLGRYLFQRAGVGWLRNTRRPPR